MKDAKESQTPVGRWLQQAGYSPHYELQPLYGGDINDTALLRTADGRTFCIKQNLTAPPDFFSCEAEGLAAIRASGTLRVPQVFTTDEHFILMEYIKPNTKSDDYWQNLGKQLATLHLQARDHFGFTADNYCGQTPQINEPCKDGYAFFRDHRLLYQAEMALQKGRLSPAAVEQLRRFAERLPELIPDEKPALLHGDLWSGNIHSDQNGEPVVIDPAVYWGWPEADIAMTLLFGGFDDGFYHAYELVKPMESGWRERAAIYNIYHLLNHANLFGSGYARQAMKVVSRYWPA